MSEQLFDYKRYVDLDSGKIDREIFNHQDIFDSEMERIFTRAWLFVGHESQVPNKGDFFTSKMGLDSVILTRDTKDKLHVFLNSCRHRGMKVCQYDHGNTKLFTCPYHSWTYKTDGTLFGVPQYNQLYKETLDKSQWPLIEVAKIQNYKGSIWATWDPDAPNLEEYLGDARLHLDMVLDCRDGREGGSEVLLSVHKWIVPSNWKFAAENFLGDTYHNVSHRSADLVGVGPSARAGVQGRRDNELNTATHLWISFPQGHGVHSARLEPNWAMPDSYKENKIVREYYEECHRLRRERLGVERDRMVPFTGTIYPNVSYHGNQPRNLCVWNPVSPTHTEAWRFFLVDADAPTEVKDFLRHFYMRYSGPAGMTEQDDMTNWRGATTGAASVIGRRYPYNYSQSMVNSNIVKDVAGDASSQMTESMARGYYKRWVDYMNSAPWSTLLGTDDKGN